MERGRGSRGEGERGEGNPCLVGCFFFFLDFFLMWTVLEVFIEFVTTLLLFCVLFLWPRGTWDPSSPTKDKATHPALEGEVRITGPPGKSVPRALFSKRRKDTY